MARIDTEQLQQLIDEQGAALVLYARQWCNAPEDALQEALIDLLRQDPVPRHPVGWLYKTVRRRAMNLARGERRRAKYQRRAGEQREAWFVDVGGEELDAGELAGMLDRLPPLEREIVVARIWGELPFERIAELTEISSSSVHRRYLRALLALGDMMNGKLDKSGQSHEQRT